MNSRPAFSAIEFLVIVGTAGLLLWLVIPSPHGQSVLRRTQATQECRILGQAAKTYFLDHGQYPDELAELAPSFIHGEIPNDPWGQPYRYDAPDDDNHTFRIYSYGADEKPGGLGPDADIGN
jgi:general secretion pathway protein G